MFSLRLWTRSVKHQPIRLPFSIGRLLELRLRDVTGFSMWCVNFEHLLFHFLILVVTSLWREDAEFRIEIFRPGSSVLNGGEDLVAHQLVESLCGRRKFFEIVIIKRTNWSG